MFGSDIYPIINTPLEKILDFVIKPSNSQSEACLNKEIIINAPSEKIFNFVVKPSNLMQIWPSLLEIRNERSIPSGGYSAQWLYEMGGVFLRGTITSVDIIPNQWFVFKTSGAIDSTITWTFRKREIQTRVTFFVDYRIPVPVLGQLARSIVIDISNDEAEHMLINLKKVFESRTEES